jgi:tetratricopeptide (TPR) repeat protein
MWPFSKKKTLPGYSNDEWRPDGFDAFQKGKDFLYKDKNWHARRQEALECFDEAIECGYVDNADVYIGRGTCLQLLDYDLDAIDDFDRAIALQPEDSSTFYQRSISKSSTGDFRGCISDLQEAFRLLGVDNKYTRNVEAHARETGYKDAAHFYRLQMDFAKTSLDGFEDSVARSGWTGLHAREYYEKRANKRRRGSVQNPEE